MVRSARKTAAVAALVILASTAGLRAENNNSNKKPVIIAASVSADRTTLFVEGENFGTRPKVTVGNTALRGVAVDVSGCSISAQLPALAEGTYLLQVDNRKFTAQFVVTLYHEESEGGDTGRV